MKESLCIDKRTGFSKLLEFSFEYKIISKSLKGSLYRLFDFRHKIHLTHGKRDPYEFNVEELRRSEKTFETLIEHFADNRWRGGNKKREEVSNIYPWKRV